MSLGKHVFGGNSAFQRARSRVEKARYSRSASRSADSFGNGSEGLDRCAPRTVSVRPTVRGNNMTGKGSGTS
jgi:hypothetical protein